MVYLYDPARTQTGLALTEKLNGKLLRFHDGMSFVKKGKPIQFYRDDIIICWGRHVPKVPGTVTYNANLAYIDALRVNKGISNVVTNLFNSQLGEWHGKIGGPQIIKYISESAYKKDLERLSVNDFRNMQMLPLKEFPGYSNGRILTLDGFYKLHVFSGKLIHAEKRVALKKPNESGKTYTYEKVDNPLPTFMSPLVRVLGDLTVDFGMVSVGTYKQTFYIRKILTAPELTPELVKIYANAFLKQVDTTQKDNEEIGILREIV